MDTDTLIEESAGMTIPEIFNREGEAGFRAREQEIIAAISRERSQVIATGGGAPLKQENRDALRQNGFVVQVERDLSALSTEGRPLSRDIDTLKRMQEQRAPIYRLARHAVISNDTTIDAAASAVLEEFYAACTGH